MPEIAPKLSKKHAIPQHIAAFEFKLIGDLTVKQFLFAGVGMAVAYAAWVSELNFFLKWGTILVSAGMGLGTAFFPIQDRTLDQWLLNFILAIFSPTQRIWRKEPQLPEFLREDYSQFLTSQVLSMTPLQSHRKLRQYLGELEEPARHASQLAGVAGGEEEEKEFVEKLNFDLPLPSSIKVDTERRKEEGESSPERLPERKEEVNIALEPAYKIPLRRNVTPGRKVRLPAIEGTIKLRPSPPFAPSELREGKKGPIKELIKKVAKTPSKPLTPKPPKPPKNGRLQRLRKQNLELKTRLGEAEKQLSSLEELKKKRATDRAYQERLRQQEKTVQKLSQKQKEAQKEISQAAPTPRKGKIPNIVSGVVKDKEGKLLENVVVIIKDQDGDPARALKTNRLGQFTISTPLENGDYTVEVSNKQRTFGIIKIETDGSVPEPIEFQEK